METRQETNAKPSNTGLFSGNDKLNAVENKAVFDAEAQGLPATTNSKQELTQNQIDKVLKMQKEPISWGVEFLLAQDDDTHLGDFIEEDDDGSHLLLL